MFYDFEDRIQRTGNSGVNYDEEIVNNLKNIFTKINQSIS